MRRRVLGGGSRHMEPPYIAPFYLLGARHFAWICAHVPHQFPLVGVLTKVGAIDPEPVQKPHRLIAERFLRDLVELILLGVGEPGAEGGHGLHGGRLISEEAGHRGGRGVRFSLHRNHQRQPGRQVYTQYKNFASPENILGTKIKIKMCG